ncbi:MAG: bifunctional phosphopantothenoylcysteine decarboxylase/phosphopantothenate--cysteine ligase CoaBC [Saprospiraceae bacterium]|nr:bifunctional phosphopantothenoylcysteine decarboxylase/phosphopantothenate--cysteine ligase CoaBC [Saprospiraceae bacterium]
MLQHKKILLGVTGSIAAYKAALLVRLFVKAGAEVKVIMTDDAQDFITPLTLATLSKHPVQSNFVADYASGVWSNHVDLGLWADYFIIAPATGNTIAKMAHGQSDNLLTATYLSARCPVFVAPAMDLDMWAHPSTQANIATLTSYGNTIIDVEEGELASGLEGKGRMAEPEHIVAFLSNFEKKNIKSARFAGKKVLISAGPTREAIDPVRFISNHSTGRMGIELAEAFLQQGAQVTLVKGPTTLTADSAIQEVNVSSAQDMFEAVSSHFPTSDITIMAAAVGDYTPVETSATKIKKKDGNLTIELERTKDILKTISASKKGHQLLVGFALETNNELENAQRKLASKNLDLIVLNSLNDKGAGFKHNTNKVTLIDKHNNITNFELKSKEEVAYDILDAIHEMVD